MGVKMFTPRAAGAVAGVAGDAGFDRMYVAIYLAGGVRRMRAGADAELGPGAW